MSSSYLNSDIVASGAVIYSTMAEVSSVPCRAATLCRGRARGHSPGDTSCSQFMATLALMPELWAIRDSQ